MFPEHRALGTAVLEDLSLLPPSRQALDLALGLIPS